ncbi:hypothetical protein BU17DRAFT_79990 [Hysterangium stoloniferum]|nr:hypothetical protein BU17DRAFT_79990 [Hysterangium stoloniferum]
MSSRVAGPVNAKVAGPDKGRTSSDSTKTRTLNAALQRKPAPPIMVAKHTGTSSIRVRKPNSSEATKRMDGMPTVNLLDIASQLYPWMFMCHSITEASKTSEAEFETQLMGQMRELEAEEEASHESRIRYQTERQITLLDEISSEHVGSTQLTR